MSEPGDHSQFTSLMDMVQSHLSRTSVADHPQGLGPSSFAAPSFSLPNICSVRNGDSENSVLPPPPTVMQLPRFEVKNSEITEILARQVKNMLVAKQNEENEKQKLSDRLKNINLDKDDDDYTVDLSASIIKPDFSENYHRAEVESPAPSDDSFGSLIFEDNMDIMDEPPPAKKMLPMCVDISYILDEQLKRGKCSVFGRVLGARVKEVAAPYLHVQVDNPDIVPFDFSTPSPCDVNKQKRKHPPQDKYSHMNMVDRFMAITEDE